MKKIVVPVDFSEHSENALKVAAKIAKSQNAEIVVVHMLGLSEAIISKDGGSDMNAIFFMKLTKKRFSEFLDKEYLNGIRIEQTVRNYKHFSEIDQVAIEHQAELIVMGSHGSSGISEMFVGSNTEKVVRTASTPVLVIKESEFELSKAVFACDFELESIAALQKAVNLFLNIDIDFQLLYINLPGEKFKSQVEIETKIEEFLNRLDCNCQFMAEDVNIYSHFSVEEGVFNFAKKINADFIGISTHGRKGLSHFFAGSIGEDIANHSNLPVLTVKI